ncbi:MAG TPA: DUF4190 domain-containing protein [Candidatus Dormibacteraeota bacterium]
MPPPPPPGGGYQPLAPPPAGGYQPAAPGNGAVAAAPNDSQATLALVLGIISVVCCSILGPVAFFIGNASLQRIRASGGTLGGAGLAQAGRILGIIGTVFLALGILYAIVVIIGAISSSHSSA